MVNELTVERVLTLVELVPPGRVVAYGDLGAIVGIGPRQVGAFMAHYTGGLPWWRVTNAAGDLPAPLLERARPHWTDEGILVKPNGRGCRISRYRADLAALAAEYESRIAATLAELGTPLPRTSAPAGRALAQVGVTTVEELSEHHRAEVAALHGMGPKALGILDQALAAADLTWRP